MSPNRTALAGAKLPSVAAGAVAFALNGCASVTVMSDGSERRFLMPPGVNVVRVHANGDAPVAVQSRGIGLTISRSGAHLGFVRETVVLLPNDGGCRLVQFQPLKDSQDWRSWLSTLCATSGGKS